MPSATVEQIEKLVFRSQQEIKTLIQRAELVRQHNPKSTNFINSFFKEAKQHII